MREALQISLHKTKNSLPCQLWHHPTRSQCDLLKRFFQGVQLCLEQELGAIFCVTEGLLTIIKTHTYTDPIKGAMQTTEELI